jgi:TonB family protein
MRSLLPVLGGLIACASAQTAPPPKLPRSITPDAQAWLDQATESFTRKWNDQVGRALRENEPSGCLDSARARRTVIAWRVAADGRLQGARITGSCGLDYLDKAALEAVGAVGALDPPPPELLAGAADRELPLAFTLKAAKGCGQRFLERRPLPYVPNHPPGATPLR